MADGADLRSPWLGRTEQVDGLDGSADLWTGWLLGAEAVPVTGEGAGTQASATAAGEAVETFFGSGAGTAQAASASGSGTEIFTGSGAGTQAAPSGSGSDVQPVTGTGSGTQPAASGSGTGSVLVTTTNSGRRRKRGSDLPIEQPRLVLAHGSGTQRPASSLGFAFVNDDDLVLELAA